MGSAALRSLASARWLVGLMAGVVVAFLVATFASQLVERRSAKQLDDIVGNAMPSVQLLALVRGDLRRIDLDLGEDRKADIAENRRNIDAALAAYRALPFFPGEQPLYAGVPQLLQRLDAQVAAASIDDARQTLDDVDRRLERVVTFDASQGQRMGLAIARARSESRGIVWLLDALSVVLAVGAMVLAIRQRRRAVRIVEEDENVARERMTELASKVDELGHFAGRVAHDIRGPLNTAMVALEVVRERAAASPGLVFAAGRGVAALERVGTLVEGLLEFARAGGKPSEGAVADVGTVIRGVVDGV